MSLENQFAYKPTSSTTAALIAMLQRIVALLSVEPFVLIISFDYSKAFDTLRHTSVASKLSKLNIPDEIHNWILDFLSNRSHQTRVSGTLSGSRTISASIVQGSVLGPTLFNINSSTLFPICPGNEYFKYADDANLLVPASNLVTVGTELLHHANWATNCNLKLNLSKTSEMVVCNSKVKPPPVHCGLERVTTMNVLGVLLDDKLSFQQHVNKIVANSSNIMFALRTLKQHGLNMELVQDIYRTTVVTKLLYAAPAWWGFTNLSLHKQIDSFVAKSKRLKYCAPNLPDFGTLCKISDRTLFKAITSNPQHALGHLLPQTREIPYSLRPRSHNFTLPQKDDKLFINRVLFDDLY
jgi:hypothetical protein